MINWYFPDMLLKKYEEIKKLDIDSLYENTDFVSYAKVFNKNELSNTDIEQHNIINPKHRVVMYKHLLKNQTIKSAADLGCGIGFTTYQLSEIFETEDVSGFEISEDAVRFARNRWPKLTFNQAVVRESEFLGRHYDLILAQEFYPFTRTDDRKLQSGILDTIFTSLSATGNIVISLSSHTNVSIFSNIDLLSQLAEKNSKNLLIEKLPHEKIFKLIRNYYISKVISNIIEIFYKYSRVIAIVISSN